MLCTLELSNIPLTDCTSASEKTIDGLLIASVAKGHKRAMERLFVRHNQAAYRFIYRITNDASLAEELVSDVFLAAWHGAATFKARSRVSTWLLAIARNKAVAALRRRGEMPLPDGVAATIPDDADDPELRAHHVSRSAVIQSCLAQLPRHHRELLDLVYYHGTTVAEAAQIVGVPEGTVKSRMAAGRLRLAGLLKEAGFDRSQEW
jgi:RNA polymerase sigma-70 factor (ECF subfamily)